MGRRPAVARPERSFEDCDGHSASKPVDAMLGRSFWGCDASATSKPAAAAAERSFEGCGGLTAMAAEWRREGLETKPEARRARRVAGAARAPPSCSGGFDRPRRGRRCLQWPPSARAPVPGAVAAKARCAGNPRSRFGGGAHAAGGAGLRPRRRGGAAAAARSAGDFELQAQPAVAAGLCPADFETRWAEARAVAPLRSSSSSGGWRGDFGGRGRRRRRGTSCPRRWPPGRKIAWPAVGVQRRGDWRAPTAAAAVQHPGCSETRRAV